MELVTSPELWIAFFSLLLLSLSWLIGLTAPLFTILGQEISGRDLILIVMVDELFIVIAAVMIAMGIMLVSAGTISERERQPHFRQRAGALAARLRQEREHGVTLPTPDRRH